MFRFSFMLLLACLSSLSLAQNIPSATSTPFVQPDPEEIFVDGVQYEEYQSQSIDTRIWQIDTTTRTILIRADVDADWQEFPFPADLEYIDCLEQRSDNTWLVSRGCDTLPEKNRVLDPATGLYSLLEVICEREIKALPGEGKWVFAWESTTDTVSLCFTETGETRTNLPDQNIWYHGGSGQVIPNDPELSPDGQYLLLRFYNPENRPEKVSLYSYELATGNSIWLGNIELYGTYQENVTFDKWLDSTHGTVRYASSSAYLGFVIYGFDLTRANSIESAFWGYGAIFDETAHRYESIFSYYQMVEETGSHGEYFPCTLSIYDVSGLTEYEFGDHCVQLSTNDYSDSYTNAYRVANRYYYLAVDEDDETVSQLRYFDLATMTVYQTYLRGEIEKIGSISPDGRYVLVQFGEDLAIDNLKGCCRIENYDAWMTVYDLESDQAGTIIAPASYGGSIWLDDNILLLKLEFSRKTVRASKNNDFYGVSAGGYRLINTDTGAVLSFGAVLFNNDLSKITRQDNAYLPFRRGVIDPETFAYTPIIREDAATEYRYRISWEGEDLIVQVLANDYSDHPAILETYRVKLP